MTKAYTDDADELHHEFGKVFTKAWEGTSSIVELAQTHEAGHVARFVHGVPAGMAKAIKALPQVHSAEVRGMFCHRSPWVFWDKPNPKAGLECRELADLMVEVEVRRGLVTASRALVVQVKKPNKETKWKFGVRVAGLQLDQRHLFHALPTFCVEFPGLPTKDQLVSAGETSLATPNFKLDPYALSGLLPQHHAGGLVYAAVNPHHQNAGPPFTTPPWLVEDGRPQHGGSPAVFTVDFARALAEMVVEDQTRFGVGTKPQGGPQDDWSRLISNLKLFAIKRAKQATWKDDSELDVVLRKGALQPNEALYNVQQLVSVDSKLMSLCSLASTETAASPDWSDHLNGFTKAARRGRIRQRRPVYQDGDGPPVWPETILEIPRQGFGVLQVRVTVGDEPPRRRG